MLKKITALLLFVCFAVSLSACEASEEIETEFSNRLKGAIEQEVDKAVEETKNEVVNKVKSEAEKIKLKGDVVLFQYELKNVDVNKNNRAEMMYIMESILEICEKNGLSNEAMQIRALYNMSTLMINAQSLYEDIDELDSTMSDVSSLITGDYVQIFADKAVSQAMKKWEKQVDSSIDKAIESTLENIANNKRIWEVISQKYLKENGYNK